MIRLLLLLVFAARAHAGEFVLPIEGGDIVGELGEIKAAYEDTFVSLGRTYSLGYDELTSANPGVDPWLPGRDTAILLPARFILPRTGRDGIVLNLAELRLYYYSDRAERGLTVQTWPVSIGDLGRETPTGQTTVVDKLRDPVWYPPERIIAAHAERGHTLARIVPPGPDNPLGDLALKLGFSRYLIHGTNRPAGIGMRITNGCIRMQPEDIETLTGQVPRGTQVSIVNQPYKLGWDGDDLFLEVHPPFGEDAAVNGGMTSIVQLYIKATAERTATIDWPVVEQVYRDARGIPVRIGRAESSQPAHKQQAGR